MPDTQISEEMVERGARAIAPLAWTALGTGDTLAQANRRKTSLRHARAALEAALSGYAVVPREPLNNLVGRLRFEREINKQRISGTDWNFYLEPLGFPAPQMERG